MFDLEAESGMPWAEIARLTYEVQASVAEEKGHEVPNWDELPAEKQLGWECGVRSLESLLNNLPHNLEYWKKFAAKRLSRHR